MLDDIDDLRVRELVLFDRLVALGTITGAARELGVPKATASRWLAQLETRFGQTLFHRGARQLTLTEHGRGVARLVPAVLSSVRALRAAVQEEQPGGTLRVSVPVPLGRVLGGGVIARFARRMPAVRLEIVLQNARVDLLRERVDLAIRGGPVADPDLIARHLATLELWLYVSTAHQERPLAEVPFIAAPGDEARFAGTPHGLLPAQVLVDDRTAVLDALGAGAGAGVLPASLGEPARAAGLVARVGEGPLSRIPVHAVFLPAQRRDPRLRILVEIMGEELRRWEPGPAEG